MHPARREKVLQKLTNYSQYKNIKVKIIGNSEIKKFKNIQILGRYDIKNLPNIIEENNIDIIFIPSIWPETYSYTTTESIEMGLFVAAFNIGAPPERLKNYEKGIIISKIDAKCALNEIIDFYTKYNSTSSSELTV
jgi:glycosyltransferase involved in cell wall biosynthesis